MCRSNETQNPRTKVEVQNAKDMIPQVLRIQGKLHEKPQEKWNNKV